MTGRDASAEPKAKCLTISSLSGLRRRKLFIPTNGHDAVPPMRLPQSSCSRASNLPAVLQLQRSEEAQKESVERAISATRHWMERFTVVVIGPGLGRDELVHKTVIEVRGQSVSHDLTYGVYQCRMLPSFKIMSAVLASICL